MVMEKFPLMAKRSQYSKTSIDDSKCEKKVTPCSYLRGNYYATKKHGIYKCLKYTSINHIIRIRINGISYQKSDRSIVRKFHYPNSFVFLLVWMESRLFCTLTVVIIIAIAVVIVVVVAQSMFSLLTTKGTRFTIISPIINLHTHPSTHTHTPYFTLISVLYIYCLSSV